MNRRRLLLSYLANSFSWQLYSKTYFYNELVPTTINGKNVLNKAKIVKVSGNGVIENQLAHEFSSTYYDRGNGATLSFLSDNTIGVLATQSYSYCCLKNIDNLFVKDHYVLITLLAKGTTNSYANVVQLYDGENWHTISGNELTANAFKRFSLLVKLRTTLTAISHFRFCQDGRTSGWDTIYAKDLMIKDITHEFGTGNEPTTLTDNRIQNILNRGYIPFNLGKYKESDIGVVSTTKADTTALDTITFKAQLGGAINSHNTMEITNSAYVFKRDVGVVDLGTQNWYVASYGFYITLNDTVVGDLNVVENIICTKYPTDTSNNTNMVGVDKTIALDQNHHIQVRDSTYSTAVDFKTAMSGVMLYYELATPQVITIPRKHLGIVDLGSLSGWTYDSSNHRVYVPLTNLKLGTLRKIAMYCARYLTIQNGESLSQVGNMSIYGAGGTAVVYIHDTELENLTSAQIQAKLSGTLLFYETENEVTDITDTIDIESGGTITTDSEVLANIELSVKCK